MEETKAAGTLDKIKELEKRIKMLEDEKYEILKGRNEMHQLKSTATKDLGAELEKMLNPNPEQSGKDSSYLDLGAELEKMLNPHPEQSGDDSSYLGMTVLVGRTVLVFQVPLHASEDDVRKSFSCCGDILSVEMERGHRCQIANVTYSTVSEAKCAVRLKRAKVCNVDVKVSAGRYSRLEDCEAWDKVMEAARKSEPSAEEDELPKKMSKKALRKSRKLANLDGKDVKAEIKDAVVEEVCSKPYEGTKKKTRKHRKKRGGKVDVSSAPGAQAAD